MAKKGFNTAATEGASVLDRLTSGAQHTQDAKDVKDVQDVKDVKDVNKEGVELARLNLKIPAELKEYLTVAAAKASIDQRRNISLTQYLCDLVTADMERHKDQ
ncbi:MAG: hypothetical protein IKZ86_08360 [Spirochaetaceae bacterium]|nr:hypothetical protein [Spirochaetaceae bacterium]